MVDMKKIENSVGQNLYGINCLVALHESERVLALVKKMEDWVEKRKGEVIQLGKKQTVKNNGDESKVWVEKKRLAYPVKKERAGYYLNSWIKLNPADLDDFRRFLKLEREIIRFAVLAESRTVGEIRPVEESVTLSEINQLALQQFPSRRYDLRGRDLRTNRTNKKMMPWETKRDAKEVTIVKEEGKEAEAEKIKDKKAETKIELKTEEQVKSPKEEPSEKEVFKKLSKEEKKPEEKKEKVSEEKEKPEKAGKNEETERKPEEEEKEGKGKSAKHKKISLEDLDQRLDDILNEDIL